MVMAAARVLPVAAVTSADAGLRFSVSQVGETDSVTVLPGDGALGAGLLGPGLLGPGLLGPGLLGPGLSGGGSFGPGLSGMVMGSSIVARGSTPGLTLMGSSS